MSAPRRTDRRDRILDVAVQEFARKGFAAVRIDEIAHEAGCNKQLIYYYFGSKADLYDAVLDQMVNGSAGVWRDMRTMSLRDAVDRLRRGSDAPQGRHWGRLTVWEGAEFGARGGQEEIHLEERRATVWSTLTDVVRRAQVSGEVDPDLDPITVATLIAVVSAGPNALSQIVKMLTGAGPSTAAFRQRTDDMVALLLDSIGPRPTTDVHASALPRQAPRSNVIN